ncbi:hypothetical protein M3484_06305 [Pseudomonas sp. GX19020]|uniref:hypothetical protein n=1 Tax=Pseudomonas sp. GX19020 TaxID=2942277 RepID=UPI002018DEDA|nr:hypothetical protein [Pseudomonas sp. GX19020]MCL4066175.1 hypothetical protein [Pseudomonas sp. GX19020]
MTLIPTRTAIVSLLGASAIGAAGCVENQATKPAAPPAVAAAAPAAPAARPLDAAGQARVAARLKELEPEFWTRRSKDGEAAANAWLQQKAVDIGREEARRGTG